MVCDLGKAPGSGVFSLSPATFTVRLNGLGNLEAMIA